MKQLLSFLVAVLGSCSVPNPGFCPKHGCQDVIRVDVTGSDAADGRFAPVKTLKRAVELAYSNAQITAIHLEPGHYGQQNGEAYPYTVPAGVTISGQPGTVLAGTSSEVGLVIDTGSLENLEFAEFTTAIHVTGTATMSTVHIHTSETGVLADGTAQLTARNLSVTGSAECSTKALTASEMANVTVDTFEAIDTAAILEGDQAVVAVSNGTIGGPSRCSVMVAIGKSLSLTDTMVTGAALWLMNSSGQLEVTLTNTTFADSPALAIFGGAHTFRMTGGELRNNYEDGAVFAGGSYTFTNVGIKGNVGNAISIGENLLGPGTIKMRGCAVTGNRNGVYLIAGAAGDFGTAADPGNNTFRDNVGVGVDIATNGVSATAVGNTWNAFVQGADPQGKYVQSLIGVTPKVDGNNYRVESGSTLQL